MSTDIRFEDNQVVFEAPCVRVKGCDLVLDAPERRTRQDGKKGEGSTRRALVHWQDELHLNFGGDYSAGVAIQGEVRMLDKAVCKKDLTCERDLLVDGTLRRNAKDGGLLFTLEKALADENHLVDYVPQLPPGTSPAQPSSGDMGKPKPGADGTTAPGGGGGQWPPLPLYQVRKLSVGEVLVELAAEILTLRKRIAELESKP